MRRVGFQLGKVERDQRSGREMLVRASRRGPIFVERGDHAPADHVDEAVLFRNGDLPKALRSQQIGFRAERIDRPHDDRQGAILAVAKHVAVDAVAAVVGLAAEDFDSRAERLAALQALQDVRVAGAAELTLVPFTGDEERVLVEPGRVLLSLGQLEPARDEPGGRQVELADGDRVLSAVGKADETAPLRGPGAAHSLEDPVGLLGVRERVDVEDRRPFGLAGLVGSASRAPQDSAHVIAVLPEIIDLVAAEAAVGNAVIGLGDLQRLVVILLVARVRLQDRLGLGIVAVDPVHRALARHILEPDVGIVGRGALLSIGRSRADDHEKKSEKRCTHSPLRSRIGRRFKRIAPLSSAAQRGG